MTTAPPFAGRLFAVSSVFLLNHLQGWNPGSYPEAPERMHSAGFTVNTQDRDSVVSFWQSVYLASEGYESRINWTGTRTSTAPGAEGTTSPEFVADVQRRVNYFRAMAGLPADTTMNSGGLVRLDPTDVHFPPDTTTKAAAAQRGALVLARNNSLSHSPPSHFIAWTPEAWNGSAKGNIALGVFGPRAVTEYVLEEFGTGSNWNSTVGHRRWVLFPGATDFGTGDIPWGSSFERAANVLYVVPRKDETDPIAPRFVAYPSAGFFPAPINSRYWSLSYQGADFTAASVSVTDAAGSEIPVTIIAADKRFGDPALVWQVGGLAASKTISSDAIFHVSVRGITGTNVPTTHSYSVTLINPDQLTHDQSLVGTADPAATVPAHYVFNPPAHTRSVTVTAFRPQPNSDWKENAENGNDHSSRIIDGTAASYSLKTAIAFLGWPTFTGISGKAFRLTFPVLHDALINGTPEQSFEIDRDIIPAADSALNYKFKRGLMSPATTMTVESSSDEGATWTVIDSVSGAAISVVDKAATTRRVALAESSTPIRIRFRLQRTSLEQIYAIDQNGVPTTTFPSGIFLDEIGISSGEWLQPGKINPVTKPAEPFIFSHQTAGAKLSAGDRWALRMRCRMGDRWMNHGAIKWLKIAAIPATGYDAWSAYEMPLLAGGFNDDDDGDSIPNGIEYAFGLDPLSFSVVADELLPEKGGQIPMVRLRRPLPIERTGISYKAEWSDDLQNWSDDSVEISTRTGVAIATVPATSGTRYLRWKIEKL